MKRMYSIVLKDGKIINVNATGIYWLNESGTLGLYNDGDTVGRFNINNIAGWINTNYKEKSCDVLDKIKAEKMQPGEIETIADALAIIDKYKIKSEG
jgi:hypothetical protein